MHFALEFRRAPKTSRKARVMTRDLKRRLSELEEAAKARRAPIAIRHLVFVGRDRKEVDANFCEGPDGFRCHRLDGEDLASFKARATDRAARIRAPVAILLFREESPDAT